MTESQYTWIETKAERRDVSKAQVVRNLIEHSRNEIDRVESRKTTQGAIDELAGNIENLEKSIANINNTIDEMVGTIAFEASGYQEELHTEDEIEWARNSTIPLNIRIKIERLIPPSEDDPQIVIREQRRAVAAAWAHLSQYKAADSDELKQAVARTVNPKDARYRTLHHLWEQCVREILIQLPSVRLPNKRPGYVFESPIGVDAGPYVFENKSYEE